MDMDDSLKVVGPETELSEAEAAAAPASKMCDLIFLMKKRGPRPVNVETEFNFLPMRVVKYYFILNLGLLGAVNAPRL
jgi:hypothetical protein